MGWIPAGGVAMTWEVSDKMETRKKIWNCMVFILMLIMRCSRVGLLFENVTSMFEQEL